MHLSGKKIPTVEAEVLIKDLTGLDPRALAVLAPKGEYRNSRALLGLKELLRRALRQTVQVRGMENACLCLVSKPQNPAGALLENFAKLFAFALAREYRYYQALPFLPLEPADQNRRMLVGEFEERVAKLTLDELIDEVTRCPEMKSGERYVPDYPVPLPGLVWEMFGIEPKELADRSAVKDEHVAPVYDKDPNGQTALGLEMLIKDAIAQYRVMLERETDTIRLMSDDDAKAAERPSARLVNMVTLFSAALLAGDKHVVTFEAPQPSSWRGRHAGALALH